MASGSASGGSSPVPTASGELDEARAESAVHLGDHGTLLVFLVGNPISGLASAPELLPKPWGTIGQLLPAEAGASALRSVAYFDGARVAGPRWVLAIWAAAGLALTALGHFRDRAAAGRPAVRRGQPALRTPA